MRHGRVLFGCWGHPQAWARWGLTVFCKGLGKGTNEIAAPQSVPLGFEEFFSNKSLGFASSAWHPAGPGRLRRVLRLGEEGEQARERRRSRFWEQGQAVPAVKMQGGRFLPRDSVLANIRGDWKWKQIRIGGSDSNTGIWRWFCSGAISCKEINMCDKLPQRAFYRLFSVLFSFQRTTAALLLFSAANSALWSGRGGISA